MKNKRMDCGVEVTLVDLLSCIGLGNKLEAGTPSTVGLDEDETAARDAALKAASKQLTYGICLPTSCSPASESNDISKKEFKFVGCNPQNCRMTSGICIDCTYCHVHCICDGDKKGKPNQLSTRNRQALISNASNCQQQAEQLHLRKSPSLMSDSSDGSAALAAALQSTSQHASPSKSVRSKSKKNKKTTRFDMGDDGEHVYLSHRMLKEHTNRSNRSYRSNSETGSHNSYMSYNSSKTGSSSRRRYNFGDENEIYNQTTNTRRRGHRRSLSGSTNSSRKSGNSFSLRLGKKKYQSSASSSSKSHNNHNKFKDDPIIGKTFSFDSGNSHSSAGIGSAYADDRTRGSATTARRANSRGGGSLSSSSRSYLDGSDVEAAAEPKKSWFRRRLESKE